MNETPEARLIAHLDDVKRVVACIAHRHRLSGAERDELASLVRVKLVDRDFDVIRRFEGRSSFRAYLMVVVQRVWLDWRTARWGKWRPSAVARRMGPVAVRLEALLHRDGYRLEHAVEVLRAMNVADSAEEIAALARQLPRRARRREVSEAMAHGIATSGAVEEHVLEGEAAEMAKRAESVMASALRELPLRASLLIKMHFLDGRPLSEVARLLAVPQKPLYRELERILAVLRRSLQAAGLSPLSVGHLLQDGRLAAHLRLAPMLPGEIDDPRASPRPWQSLDRSGWTRESDSARPSQ